MYEPLLYSLLLMPLVGVTGLPGNGCMREVCLKSLAYDHIRIVCENGSFICDVHNGTLSPACSRSADLRGLCVTLNNRDIVQCSVNYNGEEEAPAESVNTSCMEEGMTPTLPVSQTTQPAANNNTEKRSTVGVMALVLVLVMVLVMVPVMVPVIVCMQFVQKKRTCSSLCCPFWSMETVKAICSCRDPDDPSEGQNEVELQILKANNNNKTNHNVLL